MKLVIAMIQPHKLPDVKKALFGAEVLKITVTNALGSGQQAGLCQQQHVTTYVVAVIPAL